MRQTHSCDEDFDEKALRMSLRWVASKKRLQVYETAPLWKVFFSLREMKDKVEKKWRKN
jgi:hypothetical protein